MQPPYEAVLPEAVSILATHLPRVHRHDGLSGSSVSAAVSPFPFARLARRGRISPDRALHLHSHLSLQRRHHWSARRSRLDVPRGRPCRLADARVCWGVRLPSAMYLAWCTVASILNAYQLAISWRWLSRPRILCRSDPDQHPCRVGHRDPIAGGRLRYCAGVGVLEHRRRAAGGVCSCRCRVGCDPGLGRNGGLFTVGWLRVMA